MARQDDSEVQTLSRKCPSFTYKQPDYEFTSRLMAQEQLMTAVAQDMAPHFAILNLLERDDEFVSECLHTMAQCCVDAAIEAHWDAIDPNGAPDDRIESEFPCPDLEKLMAGYAGVAIKAADKVRRYRENTEQHHMRALSNILAGLDQFTRDHWGIGAQQTMETMPGLFQASDQCWFGEKSLNPDERATAYYHQLATLWAATKI